MLAPLVLNHIMIEDTCEKEKIYVELMRKVVNAKFSDVLRIHSKKYCKGELRYEE